MREDPNARVAIYISSDEVANVVVNTEYEGPSASKAYEFAYLGWVHMLDTVGRVSPDDLLKKLTTQEIIARLSNKESNEYYGD